MKACLDDITALETWRRDPCYWTTLKNRHHGKLPANLATRQDELARLDLSAYRDLTRPVCLATFETRTGARSSEFCMQTIASGLPDGALCRIDSNLFIVSPELCFVRMGRHLELVQLIELGMELCGKYALTPETKKGFESREEPLTSTEKLAAFLDSIRGIHGIKQAKAALKYVRDGSESPMETRQYMFLCLPMRLGGYGLRGATVNGTLKLPESSWALTARREFRCDLFFVSEKVVVEYDSKENHLGLLEFYRDNNKRNILLDMGIKVFVVSSAQILDVDQFDAIAHMVARAVGKRLQNLTPDWRERQARLRNLAFQSMRQN